MIQVSNLHEWVPVDGEKVERIDRTTMWGNPYHIHQNRSRWEAVEAYLAYAKTEFDRETLLELDGCRVLCHCAPALCHGNALQLLVAEAKGVTRPWVLVTGEAPRKSSPIPPKVYREYSDRVKLRLEQLPQTAVVVHGGAAGVDTIAHHLAIARGLDVVRWPADWKTFGPSAGPKRNQFMLDHAPIDTVLAFHRDIRSSVGTKDMLARAQREGYDWELDSQIEIHTQGALWDGPISGVGLP